MRLRLRMWARAYGTPLPDNCILRADQVVSFGQPSNAVSIGSAIWILESAKVHGIAKKTWSYFVIFWKLARNGPKLLESWMAVRRMPLKTVLTCWCRSVSPTNHISEWLLSNMLSLWFISWRGKCSWANPSLQIYKVKITNKMSVLASTWLVSRWKIESSGQQPRNRK